MDYNPEVERALRELLGDAQDRAQRATEEADHIFGALNAYLAKFDRPQLSEGSDPSPDLVRRMRDMSYRQMLRIWSEAHNGHVIVRDLVTAAVSTGRFPNRTKAHRTLWSTISQAAKKGEFERVGEGEYQQRPIAQELTLVNEPSRKIESLRGSA